MTAEFVPLAAFLTWAAYIVVAAFYVFAVVLVCAWIFTLAARRMQQQRRLVFLLLASIMVAGVVYGAKANAARPALSVGVATYSWQWDDPGMFAGMRDVGMTGVRLSLYRDRADYDLATIQAELPVAHANGVEVVVNLTQEAATPTAGFAEWAGAVASDLPQVDRFVIGNEVNAHRFWHGTPAAYVDLLYATSRAIHRLRPYVLVSGFALDSSHKPILWLRQAARRAARYGGLSAVMDTLSLHAYASPARFAFLLKQAEKVWRGPVNIDEAGYQGAEAAQARDEIGLLNLLSRDQHVRNVFFYRYRDSTDVADLRTANVRADGTKRLAWSAVRDWIAAR